MGYMKALGIEQDELQQDEMVDLDYQEIKQRQQQLEKEWGYNVSFYEAKSHWLLDKITNDVENINQVLREAKFAAEHNQWCDENGATEFYA